MSFLKQQHETRQQLGALCGEAVQLQITRATPLPRNCASAGSSNFFKRFNHLRGDSSASQNLV